jgi:hypothetical protein
VSPFLSPNCFCEYCRRVLVLLSCGRAWSLVVVLFMVVIGCCGDVAVVVIGCRYLPPTNYARRY